MYKIIITKKMDCVYCGENAEKEPYEISKSNHTWKCPKCKAKWKFYLLKEPSRG